MSTASLLAVVGVPVEDRVRCQAAGCNHTVYRRIHVIRAEGALQILGSSCFERLFRGQSIVRESPRFTQSSGRELTESERALLTQNTEQLITELEAAHARASPIVASTRGAAPRSIRRRHGFLSREPEALDPLLEAEAKRRVREKHGVDPEQPGWRGLVLAEARAIKGENAA